MSDLQRLIAAVEAGKPCVIPTPHIFRKRTEPDEPARIMGYVEAYAVLRHKGAGPWLETRKNVLKHLRALADGGK